MTLEIKSLAQNRVSGLEQSPWPRTESLAQNRVPGLEQSPWPRTESLAQNRVPGLEQSPWHRTESLAQNRVPGLEQMQKYGAVIQVNAIQPSLDINSHEHMYFICIHSVIIWKVVYYISLISNKSRHKLYFCRLTEMRVGNNTLSGKTIF